MKRYAFRILCPYAASTQSRRQAPSTTASVRGTHLMADECCFANSAPPEGPICGANSWPYGINLHLALVSKFEWKSHVLARSLFVQPKHAQDKSCGLTAEIQARIGHRDARTDSRNCSFILAHMLRFKPVCSPNRAIKNRQSGTSSSTLTAFCFT